MATTIPGAITAGQPTTLPGSGTPIPMPGVYLEQQALAQKAYDQSLASIQQRRQATLRQYGMTADVNAQGAYSNYRVDPNSLYGNLQLMKQAQGMDLNDSWDQAAERGLGSSGLAAQGETALRYAQGQQSQELGTQFTGAQQDLSDAQLSALDMLNQRLYQAEANARTEAIQNQMFTQVPYGSGGDGTGGGSIENSNSNWDASIGAQTPMSRNGQPLVPHGVMNNGMAAAGGTQGAPGGPGTYWILVKFDDPAGGTDTRWVQVPPGSGPGSGQAAPAPATKPQTTSSNTTAVPQSTTSRPPPVGDASQAVRLAQVLAAKYSRQYGE